VPVSYDIDLSRALVVSRWRGPLTEADVRELYDRLRADPAFDPTFRHIADLREVERVEASAEAIGSMARSSAFAPGARRALVAEADAVYGCARMFAAHAELTGSQVRVFRALGDAAQWLEFPAEAPIVIAGRSP